MPKIRRSNAKPPPDGFELIEPTLLEMEAKMREAEQAPHSSVRQNEMVWPIFRLHHQRSRYIFDLFREKAIERPLYEWCIKQKYADPNLIAKWKKSGYESLCCTRCIQTKDTNYGTTCICRVPRNQLEEGKVVECVHCGCRGCGGSGTKKEKVQEPVDTIVSEEVPVEQATADQTKRDEVNTEECEFETED